MTLPAHCFCGAPLEWYRIDVDAGADGPRPELATWDADCGRCGLALSWAAHWVDVPDDDEPADAAPQASLFE